MSMSAGVGLVSGIDFASYISQIAQVSRRPIALIQQKQNVLQTKSTALGAVSTDLTALRDQLKKMLEPSDFHFQESKSSNSDVLEITATDSAALGNYSVEVLQMANAERIASQGVSSLDTVISPGGGSFTFQVGTSDARSYDVSATTTLAELRDMINDDSDSNVTASIINDGSATNSYRMVLSSNDTGAENTISFTTNDTTLDFTNKVIEEAVAASGNTFDGAITASGVYTGTGGLNIVLKVVQDGDLSGDVGTAAEFLVSLDGGLTFGDTRYQANSATPFAIPGADGAELSFTAGTTNLTTGDKFTIDVFDPMITNATDAVIAVDGIQIRRDNNTFSNVIDGVTFTAKSVGENPVTAGVESQPGLVNAEIAKFREVFNKALETMDGLTAYNQETKQAQALFGDSGTISFMNTLRRIASSPISGLSGEYNTLQAIGIEFGADNSLSLDQAKLGGLLSDTPDAVTKIFGRVGDSSNSHIQLLDSSDQTLASSFYVDITAAATRATVDGAILAGTLAAEENLTFTYNDETFVAKLSAGDSLETVISKLNDRFSANDANLTAVAVDGALRIQTTEYGSEETFSVTSDRAAAAANQLGIGTTQIDVVGSDVAGSINGRAAVGDGQRLSGGQSDDTQGLELLITATGPTSGSVEFTRGIADRMLDQINAILGDDGIIGEKQKGIQDTIDGMNDRISKMEGRIEREGERMRRQFIAMEKQLAQYQGMGDFIAQSMAQLGNMYSRD